MFLIAAFLSALAVALHAAGAAFDALSAGIAALPHDEPQIPQPPPHVEPTPPPAAIVGETYAEYFARTGANIFGPDGHEVSGFNVFDGSVWKPAAE